MCSTVILKMHIIYTLNGQITQTHDTPTADKEGKDLNRWDQQSMSWCGNIMRWYLSSRAVVGSAIVFYSSLNVWVWTTKIYVGLKPVVFCFIHYSYWFFQEKWGMSKLLRKERKNTLWSQSTRQGNKKRILCIYWNRQTPGLTGQEDCKWQEQVHSGIAWAWCIGEVRGMEH